MTLTRTEAEILDLAYGIARREANPEPLEPVDPSISNTPRCRTEAEEHTLAGWQALRYGFRQLRPPGGFAAWTAEYAAVRREGG